MDSLLVKAKRKDNNEWVTGYYVWFERSNGHYIYSNEKRGTIVYKVIPETICRNTGFTDRAKNKAFENSIIKVILEDEFGIIKYGEYKSPFDSSETKQIGFYVEWKNEKRAHLWRKDLGYWLNATTIIVGNIFDNAELLEDSCTNSRIGN